MAALPFRAAPLVGADRGGASQLADAAGAHGLYVANALAGEAGEDDPAEIVVLRGAAALLGLLYFGHRGNLVVVGCEPIAGPRAAAAVHDAGYPWRIGLGPAAVIDELAAGEDRPPLVHRDQVYLACRPADAAPAGSRHGSPRRAVEADLPALTDAALDLHRSDLGIDPRKVHRAWLERSLQRRIASGCTWVLGPVGEPLCKLDIGSHGPAGIVLEGVYTVPYRRGEGLATALVAAAIAGHDPRAPCVSLHVDVRNAAARRTYAKAGMRPAGGCRLVLRA